MLFGGCKQSPKLFSIKDCGVTPADGGALSLLFMGPLPVPDVRQLTIASYSPQTFSVLYL